MTGERRCTWCGATVGPDDGYRLAGPAGERTAAFCRLEHLVPWAMRGPKWEAEDVSAPVHIGDSLTRCAQCETALDDTRVILVHHRGEHRIPDGFCSVEHAVDWAKAGGRWRS